MAINRVTEQGRIPFDLELKNGDQDGKEFLGFSISVRRNYKPEGEQYYPEDLIYCKAFKAKAKFIANNWNKNDEIIVEGRLQRDDDYKKEGTDELVKGQLYLLVEDAHFCGGKKGDSAPADAAPKTTTPKAGAPAKKPPLGAAKPTPGSNPLGGSKPPAKRPF